MSDVDREFFSGNGYRPGVHRGVELPPAEAKNSPLPSEARLRLLGCKMPDHDVHMYDPTQSLRG